ncbi:hypothetical protein [Treponema sp. R6D11]
MTIKKLALFFCIISVVIISSCEEYPSSFQFKNESSVAVKITMSKPYGFSLDDKKKIINARKDPFTVSSKSNTTVYVDSSDADFSWESTDAYKDVICTVNGSTATFNND